MRERAEGTWSVAGGVAHHRDLPPSLGVFVEVLDHLRGAARAARVKLPPLGQASGAPVSPPPPHRLSAPSWRPLPSPLRCLSASPAGPAGLDPPPSRSGQRRTPSAAPPPRAAAGGTYPPNTAEQVSRGGRACGGGAAGPPPARTARPASRYRLRRWWCRSRRTPPPARQCLRCACGPTRRAAATSGCRAYISEDVASEPRGSQTSRSSAQESPVGRPTGERWWPFRVVDAGVVPVAFVPKRTRVHEVKGEGEG